MARHVNLVALLLLGAAVSATWKQLNFVNVAAPALHHRGSLSAVAERSSIARHARGGARGGGDIVDTAVAAGSFKTLAAALTKAGLVDALKGAGPFTVFAPTDDAFAAALTALGITAEQLLAREDLADILKYHVVGGAKVMSTDLKTGEQMVSTLQGSQLTVTVAAGGVTVNDASVTAANVDASNGVIHVIDKVLLPR
uniref:FAS1 domain-containing protein n=1 Tax=Spumella elongata TaxID=89044 RepID=A0A7S3H1Z0_9STRA|mmetsp:Transcript_127122/g.406714  ORF Transcript_127122/g.406714 Transcript_127122/m.406714 type:complete len:198 (+) Transcript_127122:99-692(+)